MPDAFRAIANLVRLGGKIMPKRESLGGLPVGGTEPLISTAIRWGDLLFLSGRVAIVPETLEVTTNDFEEQARESLDTIMEVLRSAGSGPEHVLRVECYLTHPAYAAKWNTVFAEYFPPPRPARTTIVTGLALADLCIEIQVTAGIPGEDE
jgi:2-iminobutanoate/2-iminopropanoate deaminase